MKELGRLQLSQQLIAAEFNEVLIVRCERRSRSLTRTGDMFVRRLHHSCMQVSAGKQTP